MAFYDSTTEKTSLSPIQKALSLQPNAVLQHQDLLKKICKMANFSDEKADYTLDILLKQIRDQLTYNNPSNSHTALLIMDYCVRNGSLFGQYVFGRFILQKLYSICSRDLTKVSANHQDHQQFQYTLIGTILEWHRMYSNMPASTLNYTFSRLQQSGILALYQSYQQTQSLFKPANSHRGSVNTGAMPDLPPSPQPPLPRHDVDEKQPIHSFVLFLCPFP